ncbi:MAG TPA: hypothetical protein VH502_14565, partial [Actinoplanes sp.]
MSSTTYVKPDSVLARTAREVVEAHAGGSGPRGGMMACPVCGQSLPCPTGRAAAEVLFAAGLAQSSGLVDASRGGLGPAGESPFGAPVVPAAVPHAAQPAGFGPAAPAAPAASGVPGAPPVPIVPVVPVAPPVPHAPVAPALSVAPVASVPVAPPAPPVAAVPPASAVPAAAPEFDASGETAPSELLAAVAAAVPSAEPEASGGWTTPEEENALAVAGFDTAPPPATDPEPTEEIDPLLLGPPIYDRQNR